MSLELEIGERLKEFAKKNFGSVPKLAEKLGMSAHNLRQYTRGDAVLGGLYLHKLAELGCDVNWLLTGKGFEPASNKEEMKEKLKEMLDKL